MMADLEFLREVFKDVRQHIGIGVIKKLGLAQDNSCLRVQVNLLPENREIIAYMSFADVYDVTFPGVNELVLVAFADGLPDEAHVIARFPSIDEPIPAFARSGHSVKYARPGKKLYVGSDTKIAISRPDVEPTQPLVLGTVLVNALTAFLNAFLNAAQVGVSPAGPVFLDPSVRSALVTAMNTYLTTASTNIVSQLSFTERGT
jgi:hypothetical protein